MSTFTDADRHQQQDVANRAGAAALEPDFLRAGTSVVGAIPDEQSAHNRCRQATAYSRTDLVGQTLLEYRAVERPANERCHQRFNHYRAPLSPNQMCGKLWTHPRAAVSAIRVTASAS